MHRFIFSVLVVCLGAFTSRINAQPQESWVRIYDQDRYDRIYDTYALADGNYISCGISFPSNYWNDMNASLWLLKIDSQGNESLSNLLGQDDQFERGRSIIEARNGDYVVGGDISREGHNLYISAWRISSEGESIWSRTYGRGWCTAVIELKSGEFLLIGKAINRNIESAFAICIDGDGEVLWRHEYSPNEDNIFTSMRETEGGVILIGYTGPQNNYGALCDMWATKINLEQEGESIWSHTYRFDQTQKAFSIVRAHENGFLICGYKNNIQDNGQVDNYQSDWVVLAIDNDGNLESSTNYDWNQNRNSSEKCYGIERLNPEGYALVGHVTNNLAGVIYIDNNCEERWRRTYDVWQGEGFQRFQFCTLNTVVRGRDGSVVFSGYGQSSDSSSFNGCLIKNAPEISAPEFLYYSPDDTVFTVLQGDTVQFIARAFDAQNDELLYRWITPEDTTYNDTTVTVIFEDLGQYDVNCTVSDENHSVAITWHITVDDFFIRETSPDSLHLTARRGNTLSFTLDIACVEPDDPTIEWSTVNRDNDREYLGEADSIDVLFDLAGEWAVEAEASWNGEQESVRWVVDVRSAVWWWMPHEDAISVNRNERREFSVFPFEPDSDSLSVAWWLDGDSLESSAEALSLDFPDLGEHNLTTIVRDGVEADTIHWQIAVNDDSGVNDRYTIPTELALHPPAPNPFNSTTTIGYSLPVAGNVRVAVYDLAGREVTRLVDAVKAAGSHEALWQADGVSSGVYVVSLDAGGVMLREKVVLVK